MFGILRNLMNEILSGIKGRLADLSISTKIIMYYLILLLISLAISSILYQQVFTGILSVKISDIAFQMLNSISENFNSTIETSSEYSKIITANEDVQESLRTDPETDSSLYNELKATTSIARLIGGIQAISSVYIYDENRRRNYAYKDAVQVLNIDNIKNADWYKEVRQKRGGYIIRLNAGGVFRPAVQPSSGFEASYISLIREINDLNTQRTMGIIIVNISEKVIRKTLESIVSDYNTEVNILDSNNQTAVNTGNPTGFDIKGFAELSSDMKSNWRIWKHNNVEYMAAYLNIPENNWKVVSIMPIRELSKETGVFGLITIAVIAGNSLLIFIGAIIVSRLISVPIKKLLRSMKGIENGEFKTVDIKSGKDEIGRLRDGYNAMIIEIQNLIQKIVYEQKMKRKTELDVLQAQIKPHFLYNTFDSISSLALAGENNSVYEIMQALGTYYRTSLSKGKEVISIGEEINVVVNYLIIQKYRYEDMFDVEYDIDERVKNFYILKLVLQPFVENALYHGIRPKCSKGMISVSAGYTGSGILLQIADDGIGMDEEEIRQLTSRNLERDNPGFGVWGTIERLKIFYGVDDIVSIESLKGAGTRVTIKIPAKGEVKGG